MQLFRFQLFSHHNVLTAHVLTSRSDSVFDKASALFVNEFNGISMVVGAMKQFPNDSRLQRNCCLILARFGNQNDHRAVIKKANVGSLAGAALDNHPEDAKLASAVKTFFNTMCH